MTGETTRAALQEDRVPLRTSVVLAVLIGAAAVARIAVRLASGGEAFATEGYTFYATLAANLLAGHGLCYEPGYACTLRMPIYPLFLAAFMSVGNLYPAVVIAQSAIGGAIVWLTWRIGCELFDRRVGLIAAAAVAVHPYAVIHDTALQDTVLLNALVLACVAALLKRQSRWIGLGGLAFGLAVLTSARVALFIPFAVVWLWQHEARRLRAATLFLLPIAILLGGWMWRNDRIAGSPVLTTEGGEALYFGNSSLTFRHFPRESIDLVADDITLLPEDTQARLVALQGRDVALDAYYRSLAYAYIADHPLDTAIGALRKLWVVASGELSPARGPIVQWSYRALFVTVNGLALFAFMRVRSRHAGHTLIALLVLAFAVTTAVFWAHTSHKAYLDPFLFVYAAAAVVANEKSHPRRAAGPA